MTSLNSILWQISDALIKLKNPSGGHLSGIFSHSPKASPIDICGPAFTVEVSISPIEKKRDWLTYSGFQMVSQSDTSAPKPDKHFVDATEGHEGCVMVVSAPHGVSLSRGLLLN